MAVNPVVPTPELSIQTEKAAAEMIVRCAGNVTSSTSTLFQNTIRDLLPETKRLIIDLAAVRYMDSSGLGALVAVWVSARKADCQLKIFRPSQRLKDLFRLTNLGSVFEGNEEYLGIGG